MATTTISLPEQMREFVESDVAIGNYGSASELFRDLVRERQKRKSQERLETLLLEGLESAQPIEVTQDELNERRQSLRENLKEKERTIETRLIFIASRRIGHRFSRCLFSQKRALKFDQAVFEPIERL